MKINHGIVKCKYCDKIIRQCRCPGPHETIYELCSSECKRREDVNAHQVANEPKQPRTAEEWWSEWCAVTETKINFIKLIRRAQEQARCEAIEECLKIYEEDQLIDFTHRDCEETKEKIRALLDKK